MEKKIGFIISSLVISGGTNVIFEHAIRIHQRAENKIFFIMKDELDPNHLFWFPEAKQMIWLTYEDASDIDFDVIIATWWLTCYELYKLKSKSYIFFCQSIESKFYKSENFIERKYADSTYLLGLNVITEATWIKDYLIENYGIDAELALNGIRKDIYTSCGPSLEKKDDSKLRILIEGQLGVFFKNTEKTIQLCLKSKADEVWLLTKSCIEEFKDELKKYPEIARIISNVPIHKTPEIYRSCDVIVKLSYVEGMFGPPLEMFHCGGTAIVYDVTGHDEYIIDGYNAYVVKTDDEERVVELIDHLKENKAELNRLKDGARETALKWYDWETASMQFEKAIQKSIQKPQVTQHQLQQKTMHFNEWYSYSGGAINNFKDLLRMNIYFFIKGQLKTRLYLTFRTTFAYRIYKKMIS